jgi:hypothetical protein
LPLYPIAVYHLAEAEEISVWDYCGIILLVAFIFRIDNI